MRGAAKKTPSGFEVYVAGGRTPTDLDAVAWAKEVCERGAGEILLTSMDKDGTKSGFDFELTRQVCEAAPIPVIASGGCGTWSILQRHLNRLTRQQRSRQVCFTMASCASEKLRSTCITKEFR